MKTGVFGQPAPDRRMLGRAVVVADQVNLWPPVSLVDRLQEADELHVRVFRKTPAVNLAADDLQSCEKARRPVPFVVVSHPRRQTRPQRQNRLSPVERLDLGLLVDAQDEGPFRRIMVEADNVSLLAVEVRIGTELEPLHSMRL